MKSKYLQVAGVCFLTACGPGIRAGESATEDGSTASETGTDSTEPTADETDGDGTDGDGTDDADAGSTDAADSDGTSETGEPAASLCFTKTEGTVMAADATPIALDSDARADLATTGLTVTATAPLELLLNEGNGWSDAASFPLDEFGRFELVDVDLDGLTDVVIDNGTGPEYFHNLNGGFDAPVALDPLFVGATFVDFNDDQVPDVVKVQGAQVEVFTRASDGSGQLVGTFELPLPDIAPPVGDSCEDWALVRATASVGSPHAMRRFSRNCEGAGFEDLYDIVEFDNDGSPTWLGALPTPDVVRPTWLGDLEGDGVLDVLELSGRLSRLVDGGTEEIVDLGTSEVVVGDIDGDGLMDLVARTEEGTRIESPLAAVHLAAESWVRHALVEGSRPIAIADFDGDGDGDILIHSWLIGTAHVLNTHVCLD